MKQMVRLALLCGAMALAPLPLSAQPVEAEHGMEQDPAGAALLDMFAGLYDTGDLEPVDPARLELATVTAEKLIPAGAYAELIGSVLDDMLSPLLSGDSSFGDMQIVAATGVDGDTVAALDEKTKTAILDLLDPHRKQRADVLRKAMLPAMTSAISQMEAPLREGIARAYARRLSAEELGTINAFLSTPTGTKYARETFAVYADPEVMQASMEAMPQMIGAVFADGEAWQTQIDAIPKERQLGDLSDDELGQLARMLDVDVDILKGHRGPTVVPAEEYDFAPAGGGGEWDDHATWSESDRALVEQLEAEADAALERYYAAYEQAAANADAASN